MFVLAQSCFVWIFDRSVQEHAQSLVPIASQLRIVSSVCFVSQALLLSVLLVIGLAVWSYVEQDWIAI